MTYQSKLSKIISTFLSKFFQVNLNNTIENSTFSKQLKYPYVKSVFKKDFQTNKKNYRLISILYNASKVSKRCLNKQLEEYFQTLLHKYQCGFQNGYSVINASLAITEKWKKHFDKGGAFGALLTDFSKAFDYLSYERLIAKLHTYGVYILTYIAKLHNYGVDIHSYLLKVKQE